MSLLGLLTQYSLNKLQATIPMNTTVLPKNSHEMHCIPPKKIWMPHIPKKGMSYCRIPPCVLYELWLHSPRCIIVSLIAVFPQVYHIWVLAVFFQVYYSMSYFSCIPPSVVYDCILPGVLHGLWLYSHRCIIVWVMAVFPQVYCMGYDCIPTGVLYYDL